MLCLRALVAAALLGACAAGSATSSAASQTDLGQPAVTPAAPSRGDGCLTYETGAYYRQFWPEQARYDARLACELNQELSTFGSERRSCTTSAECTTIWTWCPFGCGLAVARAYAGEVADKYSEVRRRYRQLSDGDCKYRCAPVTVARCQAGQCEAD